jgi:hypothetical protein
LRHSGARRFSNLSRPRLQAAPNLALIIKPVRLKRWSAVPKASLSLMGS